MPPILLHGIVLWHRDSVVFICTTTYIPPLRNLNQFKLLRIFMYGVFFKCTCFLPIDSLSNFFVIDFDCLLVYRTSNGKSTVINAMLREKILPSGIGHTTNCFLQVEGSDSGDSYLVTEDSTEKQNVKVRMHIRNTTQTDQKRHENVNWIDLVQDMITIEGFCDHSGENVVDSVIENFLLSCVTVSCSEKAVCLGVT
jgi:hypothetical protein